MPFKPDNSAKTLKLPKRPRGDRGGKTANRTAKRDAERERATNAHRGGRELTAAQLRAIFAKQR